MPRVPRELVLAGVLGGALAGAFWLVRGGPGVDALVQLARNALEALLG